MAVPCIAYLPCSLFSSCSNIQIPPEEIYASFTTTVCDMISANITFTELSQLQLCGNIAQVSLNTKNCCSYADDPLEFPLIIIELKISIFAGFSGMRKISPNPLKMAENACEVAAVKQTSCIPCTFRGNPLISGNFLKFKQN